MLLLVWLAGCVLLALSACAPIAERIVNGEVVEHGQIPWQLSVFSSVSFCGAVAIAKNIVLTAAHCVDEVEDHDLYENERESQLAWATHIATHESWNHGRLLNDIAIIHVDPPFKWDQFCQRVRLPPNNHKDYVNHTATVSGWGRTSANSSTSRNLLKAVMPITDHTECKEIWRYYYIPESQLCVKDPNLVHSVCFGDSGGPLTIADPHSGHTTLVGLISFGHSACSPAFGDVYTRVSHYLAWISRKMNELGAIQED